MDQDIPPNCSGAWEPVTDVPLDNLIYILILAGILLAVIKLYKRKK